MRNNSRFSLFALPLLIVFFTLLLTGCPSGGGGNNTNTGDNFDIGDYLPFRIVTLDNQTGPFPAGNNIPLACIDGGFITGGGELNCPPPHLHDSIFILDIGGPYVDPDQFNCGHGQVGFSTFNNLDYRCDKVENASLKLVTEEFTLFNLVVASFFLPGNFTSVPDHTVDITSRLSMGGTIPIEESAGTTYSRMQLYVACFRGFNSATSENEYVHEKYFFNLSFAGNRYLEIECTPHASMTTANVDVTLGMEYSGGVFYTGGRSVGAQMVTGNATTSLSFPVKPTEKEKTGFLIAYDVSGWNSLTLKYDPQVSGSIDTNVTSPEPMQDKTVKDAGYMSDPDYLGIDVKVKAAGLYQTYYSLDPTTPPAGSRVAPVGGGFSKLGGMFKFTGTFNDLESGTGYQRSASISKYQSDTGDINFSEPKPTYIDSQTDIQFQMTTLNGFKVGLTYTPNVTGQEMVKLSVRAETVDMSGITPIRHIWKGINYGDSSVTDMAYVDTYYNNISVAPSLLPTESDVNRIRLNYSDKPTEATNYDMYRKYSLGSREGETSVVLGVNF